MTSPLLTRDQIGLRDPVCRVLYTGYEGITVHYPGPSPWTTSRSVGGKGIDRSTAARFAASADHRFCPIIWRGYQAYHMDSKSGCDIFYSSGVCPHGWRLDGRGPGVKSGAQGTNDGNRRSVGIQYMGGITSGDELDPLTDAAKLAFRDEAIRYNRRLVWGHKDWLDAEGRVRTACPGGIVYAWRLAGFLMPSTAPPPPVPKEEDDMPYLIKAPGRHVRLVVGDTAILFPTNAQLSRVRTALKEADIEEKVVDFETAEDYDYIVRGLKELDQNGVHSATNEALVAVLTFEAASGTGPLHDIVRQVLAEE